MQLFAPAAGGLLASGKLLAVCAHTHTHTHTHTQHTWTGKYKLPFMNLTTLTCMCIMVGLKLNTYVWYIKKRVSKANPRALLVSLLSLTCLVTHAVNPPYNRHFCTLPIWPLSFIWNVSFIEECLLHVFEYIPLGLYNYCCH